MYAALKWPKGVQILLDAGACVDDFPLSDSLFIQTQDPKVESLAKVLESGQVSDGWVRLALVGSDHWLCEHAASIFAKRRQALAALARLHLPPLELEALGIVHSAEDQGLLDFYAVATVETLTQNGHVVPKLLQPWGRRSLYDTHYGEYAVRSSAADALYDAGFRDLHVPKANGFTLLHEFCFYHNIEMVEWMLVHGEDLRTSPATLSCNCFHLLAAGAISCFSSNAPPRLWSTVLHVVGLSSTDACLCACSAYGCTATSMLFRQREPTEVTWHIKLDRLQQWYEALSLSIEEIETCCEEFMRLETFERLDITHVCCSPLYAWYGKAQMSEDDQIEIMDEESSFIDELDTLMERYRIERPNFRGSAIAFLGRWSAVLREEGLNEPSQYEDYRIDDSGVTSYFAKPEHEDMIDIFWEGRYTIPNF